MPAADPVTRPQGVLPFGLRFALALAVPIALLELAIRWTMWEVAGRRFRAGFEILWMAPLANLLWFAMAAVAAWVLVRLLRGRAGSGIGLTAAIIAIPALTSLAWLHPNLHKIAVAILALGVAVQLARWVERRPDAMRRWTARAARISAAAGMVAALTGLVLPRLTEWRALHALPDAPDRAPNVLLLVLDTVRSFSMSVYGYDLPTTPELDRLARTSVRFDRAFVTAPWTLPSHATMFTGRYAEEVNTGPQNPLGPEFPTLAEALAGAGYATGGFVANTAFATWEHGLARGFLRYRDYPATPLTLIASTALGRTVLDRGIVRRLTNWYDRPDRKPAPVVQGEFLEWLDEIGDRPFFAFINYFDAHHPLLPPAPYDSMFGPPPPARFHAHPLRMYRLKPGELELTEHSYDGAIAYVDAQVKQLLDALERRGVLDETMVIITSDHGEHWGDHGRVSHGNSLYRELLQVPLLIRYPPAFAGGTTVRQSVSLRDLPATVLDVTGVENGGRFPGRSLRDPSSASPVLAGEASLGMAGAAALITDSLHYIVHADGREELYDLEADSLGEHDLSSDPANRALLRALRDSVQVLRGGTPREIAAGRRPAP